MFSINPHTVRSLDQFTRMPGHFVDLSNAAVLTAASSPAECAVKCRQFDYPNLKRDCRSFQFCGHVEQSSCLLYETRFSGRDHNLKSERNNSSLTSAVERLDPQGPHGNCIHYVLRRSADYTAVGMVRLNTNNVPGVTDVSVEQCAEHCSRLSDGNCLSLAYCAADPTENSLQSACLLYPTRFDNLTVESIAAEYGRMCTVYASKYTYIFVKFTSYHVHLSYSPLTSRGISERSGKFTPQNRPLF